MKFTRKFLVGVALSLLAAQAAEAQPTRTVDAGNGLYLQQVLGRTQIHEPERGVSDVALPALAAIWSLTYLDDGWIATGSAEGPAGTDLILLRSLAGKREELPLPENETRDPLRHHPTPFVHNGQLVGLAWVAGESVTRTAVYSSHRSGDGWSAPEIVSPVGPGTQMALSGAVLADGTWLLAWAAYDGEDDEIVWSARSPKGWSAPVPIHAENHNPDVVPSLVAVGGGALAAWSSSDGTTYRVRLAKFGRGGWTEILLGSPPGSFHASLVPSERGPYLLYRTVAPDTWTLYELDEHGARPRRARLDGEADQRPGLAVRGSRFAGFEWLVPEVQLPVRIEAEWRISP